MPIYEYRCADCRQEFEKRRPMSKSDAEIACPDCGGLHTKRGLSLFSFSRRNGGSSEAMAGGGGCGRCSSHACGSCNHH